MFCQEWCLVKRTRPGLTVLPLRCKCWSCDLCRPRRHYQLVQEALRGKPDLFITLTSVYKPGRCPHAAARALVRAWRRVRTEYLKKNGKRSLPFLCVFEATRNGWPHIHIVARCKWLDQRWLSKRMADLIGAPVVDVRRVRHTRGVAKYVAKYIGKQTERFEGVKRYWRSMDYFLPLPSCDPDRAGPSEPWTIVKVDWLSYIQECERLGYCLTLGRDRATLLYGRPP